MEEPAHIKFMTKIWEIKENPANPVQLLVSLILMAATDLPAIDVKTIEQRVIKEGIRVYVTNGLETEMLIALRRALQRAEAERDHNRVRASHFQAEAEKAQARVVELEKELADKRKTLGFLEQGLARKTPCA